MWLVFYLVGEGGGGVRNRLRRIVKKIIFVRVVKRFRGLVRCGYGIFIGKVLLIKDGVSRNKNS